MHDTPQLNAEEISYTVWPAPVAAPDLNRKFMRSKVLLGQLHWNLQFDIHQSYYTVLHSVAQDHHCKVDCHVLLHYTMKQLV